jgi:hypothetical protein
LADIADFPKNFSLPKAESVISPPSLGMHKEQKMATVLVFPMRHMRTSVKGLGTSGGHSPSSPSGQLSENQRIARSKRPTLISAPSSKARSFLPSSKARELTVERGTSSNSAYARATLSKSLMADIGAMSVSLPVKSTAFLPGVEVFPSGYPTDMELAVILQNIERLLKARGISADEASRKAGHPDAIRNAKRKLKRGSKGSMRADTLAALARVLGVTQNDLARSDRVRAPPIPGLREALLAQRAFIDEQIAALDEAEAMAQKPPKRNKR